MVHFLFILGKNWQYSLCELEFVLRTLCPNARILQWSKTACFVDFPRKRPDDVPVEKLQFYLGGIQKIALITGQFALSEFQEAFPEDIGQTRVFQKAREKLEVFLQAQIPKLFGAIQPARYFFAHSIYPEAFTSEFYKARIQYIIPFLTQALERLLKSAGAVKVGSYRYPAEPLHSGTLNPIFPHHVLRYRLLTPTRAEIIWALFPDQVVVGRTFAVSDPLYLKMIDEERPFQMFEGSLPPKYAKALLNFATQGLTVPKGERIQIYDPFCGTGTVLIFGLLFEFNVFGSDINPACVTGTRENLAWYSTRERFNSQDWTKSIQVTDVTVAKDTFPFLRPYAITTEPILLPYYREPPTTRQAKTDISERVIPTYRALFQLASDILVSGGRLCCTFPVIQPRDASTVRTFLNLQNLIPSTLEELSLCDAGIPGAIRGGFLLHEQTNYVSREVHLFQHVPSSE